MKNTRPFVPAIPSFWKSLFLLCLLLGLAAGAQAEQSLRVTGVGRVFYEPDSYDLSFGIVTTNLDVQQCKAVHLGAVERVREFLDTSKSKTLSLRQNAARLERFRRSDDGRVVKEFYQFTTSFVIRVKDVKGLVALQEGLITAGVTDITSLDIFSEKMSRLTEQSRKEAIKDAKSKAELAAAELGWTITGAAGIDFLESEWSQRRNVGGAAASRAYEYGPSGKPADLTTFVETQVNISFTFEKKK